MGGSGGARAGRQNLLVQAWNECFLRSLSIGIGKKTTAIFYRSIGLSRGVYTSYAGYEYQHYLQGVWYISAAYTEKDIDDLLLIVKSIEKHGPVA